MLIANPIYDSVFKFLMEDLTVAKCLLSTIIGEEIVELEVRPQEQTRASNKYLLTVFRVDFKAIIKPDDRPTMETLISATAHYGVSLAAAILGWLEYTSRRAIFVVSRDGGAIWARSSDAAP